VDCQKIVFDWVASQPGLTGAALLAGGLLYGLCGYRFIRILVLVPCVGVGCLLGLLVARSGGLPALVTVPTLGVLAGLLAHNRPAGAVLLTSTATVAALGGYLAAQMGASTLVTAILVAVFGGISMLLTLLSRATMIMVHTTLLGAALTLIGAVGVGTAIAPTLATTFRQLVQDCWPIVPLLLLVSSVSLYSYQANVRQGDILTGARAEPRL
jgi:hypothetical protein